MIQYYTICCVVIILSYIYIYICVCSFIQCYTLFRYIKLCIHGAGVVGAGVVAGAASCAALARIY